VEPDFVDLPNYIKIKLLIGDCGFYINEIEGMYLDVMGRNLLKKLYHYIFILFGNLPLYNGGNHYRGNSGCVH
jgi:hypothetical protein